MKLNSIVLIMAGLFIINGVFAKEKKKSKKVLAQEAAIKPFRDKATALEAELAKLKEDNAKLAADINVLNEENKSLQAEAMKMEQEKEKATSVAIPQGLAFKIQLGAYNASVVNTFTDNKMLQSETVEGKNKYVIGYFKDFADAKQAEKDFKKLGIRDTWLVPYKNGARISDADANAELNFDIRKAK